jgi:hypothetical protein
MESPLFKPPPAREGLCRLLPAEPGPNRGDDLPADDTQLPSVVL